jgi:hypothetical protein
MHSTFYYHDVLNKFNLFVSVWCELHVKLTDITICLEKSCFGRLTDKRSDCSFFDTDKILPQWHHILFSSHNCVIQFSNTKHHCLQLYFLFLQIKVCLLISILIKASISNKIQKIWYYSYHLNVVMLLILLMFICFHIKQSIHY